MDHDLIINLHNGGILMKFQIKENCCRGVHVWRLSGRAMFKHGGSWYRRVESCGQGVSLNHSANNIVIMNLKCGTLREIHAKTMVEVYEMCRAVELSLVNNPEADGFLIR